MDNIEKRLDKLEKELEQIKERMKSFRNSAQDALDNVHQDVEDLRAKFLTRFPVDPENEDEE